MTLRAVKLQPILRGELSECSDELAAEDAAQCVNRQEAARRRIDPTGAENQKSRSPPQIQHRLTLPALPTPPQAGDRPFAPQAWPHKSVPCMSGGSVEFSHERRHAAGSDAAW